MVSRFSIFTPAVCLITIACSQVLSKDNTPTKKTPTNTPTKKTPTKTQTKTPTETPTKKRPHEDDHAGGGGSGSGQKKAKR
jgi:hypothetical protein